MQWRPRVLNLFGQPFGWQPCRNKLVGQKHDVDWRAKAVIIVAEKALHVWCLLCIYYMGIHCSHRHLTTIFKPSFKALLQNLGGGIDQIGRANAENQSLGVLHYVRFDEILDEQAIPITVDEVPVLLLATRPGVQGFMLLGLSPTPANVNFDILNMS